MNLLRKYIRTLLSEDAARRQAFAQELSDDPEWDPEFKAERTSDPEKEKEVYRQTFKVGRKLKTLFAKHADRSFLDSLTTVHWGDSNRILDIFLNVSSRDELSTSVYLPGDVGSSTWGPGKDRAVGLVVKGHITILSNHMNDLMSGKGEIVKTADPERAKMSGASKGIGRAHPRKRTRRVRTQSTTSVLYWCWMRRTGTQKFQVVHTPTTRRWSTIGDRLGSSLRKIRLTRLSGPPKN